MVAHSRNDVGINSEKTAKLYFNLSRTIVLFYYKCVFLEVRFFYERKMNLLPYDECRHIHRALASEKTRIISIKDRTKTKIS